MNWPGHAFYPRALVCRTSGLSHYGVEGDERSDERTERWAAVVPRRGSMILDGDVNGPWTMGSA
jgi:hypothetical protein